MALYKELRDYGEIHGPQAHLYKKILNNLELDEDTIKKYDLIFFCKCLHL
jgi:hypothetical protein